VRLAVPADEYKPTWQGLPNSLFDRRHLRSQTILLVTTLLDPVTYPAEEIRQLYLQRWTVELHFRCDFAIQKSMRPIAKNARPERV
jgi:hypothetical protein